MGLAGTCTHSRAKQYKNAPGGFDGPCLYDAAECSGEHRDQQRAFICCLHHAEYFTDKTLVKRGHTRWYATIMLMFDTCYTDNRSVRSTAGHSLMADGVSVETTLLRTAAVLESRPCCIYNKPMYI